MKKLINLAGILSLFFLFSCSNLIENKNTSVRVVLPEAENVARTIGISYELADVAEYSIIFEGENFNNTYTCNPGDDLYINEINAGEYKVTGYAKNKDGECIGYGVTVAVVLPEQENEVEIVLKKNIVSNIATVIPSRTLEKYIVDVDTNISLDNLISDIQLDVNYFSGYTTKIGLNEILDTGFFFTKTYLIFNDNKKQETTKIDFTAKKIVLSLCKYDCTFDDFIKIKENPELLKEPLVEQELSSFEYDIEIKRFKLSIYEDQDITSPTDKIYGIESDIIFDTPTARTGFTFGGWYFYEGEEEISLISDNKITKENITNYITNNGCVKGKWLLNDATQLSITNFPESSYTSKCITINLKDEFNNTGDETYDINQFNSLRTFVNTIKNSDYEVIFGVSPTNTIYKTLTSYNNKVLVTPGDDANGDTLCIDGRKINKNGSSNSITIPNEIQRVSANTYVGITNVTVNIPVYVKQIEQYAFDTTDILNFASPYMWCDADDDINQMIQFIYGTEVDNISTNYNREKYYYRKVKIFTNVNDLVADMNVLYSQNPGARNNYILTGINDLSKTDFELITNAIKEGEYSYETYLDFSTCSCSNNTIESESFNFPRDNINESIKAFYLPKTLQKIESRAFLNCGTMEDVVFPADISDICGGAFVGVQDISNFSFDGANTKYTISSKMILSADGKTLYVDGNQNTSKSFTVPESINNLEEYVYYRSPNSRIFLNETVYWIKENAFNEYYDQSGTHNLSIIVKGQYLWKNKDGNEVEYTVISSTICAGTEVKKNYLTVSGGYNNLKNSIANRTDSIIIKYEDTDLTEAQLEELSSAIRNNNNRIILDLSNCTFTSIPTACFQNLNMLVSIILPQSLETIGQAAFSSSGIAFIYIPPEVNSIGSNAFIDTSNLTIIFFEDTSGVWTDGGGSTVNINDNNIMYNTLKNQGLQITKN